MFKVHYSITIDNVTLKILTVIKANLKLKLISSCHVLTLR